MPHSVRLPLYPTDGKWGTRSVEIINGVLAGCDGGMLISEVLKKCRGAYPFGERANHPYKIWCSKIKQLKILLDGGKLDRQYSRPSKRAPRLDETPLFGGLKDG